VDRLYGGSLSLHGLSDPGQHVLHAGAALLREGRAFSLVEHEGPLTLSSDSFSTGGGTRKHYDKYSTIPLMKGQSLQLKSGVVAGTTQRYVKIIGIILAVGVGFAAIAGLVAALWYSNRLLSPYGFGGYGLDGCGWGGYGWGGLGPWGGCW
jgi:hypothetical protein